MNKFFQFHGYFYVWYKKVFIIPNIKPMQQQGNHKKEKQQKGEWKVTIVFREENEY